MTGFKRTIIVGDIHGCADEFIDLIWGLNPIAGQDRVFGLGDLVDKGPHSLECIREAEAMTRSLPGSGFIMGNHEIRWLKIWDRHEVGKHPAMFDAREDDIAFLRTLPLFIRLPDIHTFLCHGGIYPRFFEDHGTFTYGDDVWHPKGKRGRDAEKLAYTRKVKVDGDYVALEQESSDMRMWSDTYDGREGFAFFGHTPRRKPIVSPHAMGIDTGCVFGWELTAVVIDHTAESTGKPKFEVVTVKARQQYSDRP